MNRTRKHLNCTKRPYNPVELDVLKIKSAIEVRVIFSNHQIFIINKVTIQKGFTNHIARRAVEAFQNTSKLYCAQ